MGPPSACLQRGFPPISADVSHGAGACADGRYLLTFGAPHGHLDNSARMGAVRPGTKISRDPSRRRQPDVVLVSVKWDYFANIAFPQTQELRIVHAVDGPNRRSSYQVKTLRRRLLSGKEPLFVFGRAAQTPFATVSDADKRLIGQTLLAEAGHE